jgi:hypothetical protein
VVERQSDFPFDGDSPESSGEEAAAGRSRSLVGSTQPMVGVVGEPDLFRKQRVIPDECRVRAQKAIPRARTVVARSWSPNLAAQERNDDGVLELSRADCPTFTRAHRAAGMTRLRTVSTPVPGIAIWYDFVTPAEEQYLIQASRLISHPLKHDLIGCTPCRKSTQSAAILNRNLDRRRTGRRSRPRRRMSSPRREETTTTAPQRRRARTKRVRAVIHLARRGAGKT